MSAIDDLVTWLRGVLDEAEADWLMVRDQVEIQPMLHGRHLPTAALADIEAKRAILDGDRLDGATLYAVDERGHWSEDVTKFADYVIRLLAWGYRERAGYREEWRP